MIVAGAEKMKVSVQQSTMVRPSSDTPNRILWSSDLDLLVPMFHVQTVYFYKPNGSSMFFETQVLKDALSDVLVPFYPAAGRMGKNDDGRIEIHCNGEGILFVEAETSCFIDDLGDFTDSSKLLPSCPGGRLFRWDLFISTRRVAGIHCLAVIKNNMLLCYELFIFHGTQNRIPPDLPFFLDHALKIHSDMDFI
ncbi:TRICHOTHECENE 3-O-ACETYLTRANSFERASE, partial [Salix koriyanagi]